MVLTIVLALRRGRSRGPSFVSLVVELVQQVPESVRNTLPDDVVVNSLQDIAEPSLILATEASSGLS
jgi:hypothetical protein